MAVLFGPGRLKLMGGGATLPVALVLVSVCGAAMAADAPAQQTRFVQDRFAIGLWVDPPGDERFEERYAELAEANFTVVLGGFGGTSQEKVRQRIALCEQHDMKVLVSAGQFDLDAYPTDATCWGYRLVDEPNASRFPELAERVAEIRSRYPGKLAYINLFPDYASPKQLGSESYDAHLAEFCRVVDPDVLSMDHYPRFHPDHDGRDGYCRNLAAMRKHSMAHGIPFWNFFNAMPFGAMTDPTESQMRWQIYSSLAYGAKGVLYFCYYTPLSHEFPKGGALIARDDRRTRHWYQAKRINAELKNLGPTLMQLTSTGVFRVTPDDDPAEVLEGTPIRAIARVDVDPDFEYLVGVFEHADGRRAVLLNNYHFAYCQWPTVVFDAEPGQVMEVSKTTGKEAPIVDDSPDMDGLQVSLDAGEGRLFLLP
ncbi:MAG: hypothetical protein GY851_32395 [bacterium]|nr:hypothetical protein [bacterium]